MKTMKKIALLTALLFLLTGNAFAADQTIASTEEMVGSGHATKTDTLNRHGLVEHNTDGTHAAITPTSVTSAGAISGTTGTFTGAITATGGQIVFPATAVPSANVNTLDDYEEGTWTPAFVCTTSGTITVNTSYDTMSYTKVGRKVTLAGLVIVASISSPVGGLQLTGLPFVNQAGTERSADAAVALRGDVLNVTGATVMQGFIAPSVSLIAIEYLAEGVATGAAPAIKASSIIVVNVTYFTN